MGSLSSISLEKGRSYHFKRDDRDHHSLRSPKTVRAMTSSWNAILHGQNSTAQPLWYPNPTVRGTWNIYQTCVIGESNIEEGISVFS